MTVALSVLFRPGQGLRESARTRQGRLMREDGLCPLPLERAWLLTGAPWACLPGAYLHTPVLPLGGQGEKGKDLGIPPFMCGWKHPCGPYRLSLPRLTSQWPRQLPLRSGRAACFN